MRYQHLKTFRVITKVIIPLVPLVFAGILMAGVVSIPHGLRDASIMLASPFRAIHSTLFCSRNISQEDVDASSNRASYALEALQRDNDRLRSLLGRSTNTHTLPAGVLPDARLAPFDTFAIDLGARDGIREGMLVILPGNIALGFIDTAHSITSTGLLFSAPGNTFMGTFSGTLTLHIEITGDGGGTMHATVPRDVPVAIGDAIVLPGFNTYAVGIVVAIEVEPEDAFKTIYIRSLANISTLRFVHVDTTHIWNNQIFESNVDEDAE